MPITLTSDRSTQGFARHMGKIIQQMHSGYSNFAPGEIWTPSVNLYETDATYLVCVDLAGVEKSQIDITVDGHVLQLRGKREVPKPEDHDGHDPAHGGRVRVHLMEIDHGSFCREVDLPRNVRQDRINARYTNGMLWIELPKH